MREFVFIRWRGRWRIRPHTPVEIGIVQRIDVVDRFLDAEARGGRGSANDYDRSKTDYEA